MAIYTKSRTHQGASLHCQGIAAANTGEEREGKSETYTLVCGRAPGEVPSPAAPGTHSCALQTHSGTTPPLTLTAVLRQKLWIKGNKEPQCRKGIASNIEPNEKD